MYYYLSFHYKGDYYGLFSTFIQMLHAKKLSQNTIRVYVSYIKPYLTYLEKLQLSPDQASYQTMREFLDQIQSQQGQHGLVGAAGRPGKQADACPGQGTDRAAADAAADDRVYALALQIADHGAVTAGCGIHNGGV